MSVIEVDSESTIVNESLETFLLVEENTQIVYQDIESTEAIFIDEDPFIVEHDVASMVMVQEIETLLLTIGEQGPQGIQGEQGPPGSIVDIDSDAVNEGETNLYFTNERVDDRVNALLQEGDNISLSYDDIGNSLSVSVTGIEDGAEVNNISDINATDLTDAGDSFLHYHSTDRDRTNHTGTQLASSISDFDSAVSGNSDVVSNTAKNSYPSGDATKVGYITITQAIDLDSIDESFLSTSVNASLDLADSSSQPGDNISDFTNDSGYITATLTAEEVQDVVGGMISGASVQTRITVSYDDPNGELDFLVDDDLANYDNTNSGFLTDVTEEEIEELSDVVVTTPADNEVLAYDSSSGQWINQTPEESGLSAVGHGHTASDISDFDTEVSNNTDVSDNTAERHSAVTVTDSSEIDFTLDGQDITASLIEGSIDILKLDSGVQSSLSLADSALQSGDNVSALSNDAGYISDISGFNIDDIGDVVITTPSDNQALAYDTSSGNWINQDLGGAVDSVNGKTGTVVLDTGDISESGNLYFTDERAQDAVGGIIVDSSEIDFTYNDGAPSITASLKSGSIDESKLDASVNASLNLADSSAQSGDNISIFTNNSGYITDYTVTESDVTAHQAALTITESQISDLGSYYESGDTPTFAGATIANLTVRNFSASSDIDTLLPGSGTGSIIEHGGFAHFVIGIQGNDSNDGFYVVDTNNGGNTGPYAQLLLAVSDAQFAYKGTSVILSGDSPTFNAITATSYGGITEANLVDKSATESITGAWDFSNIDINDANVRTLQFDNLEPVNLTTDLEVAVDASRGLIIYRNQQIGDETGNGVYTVLDSSNIAAGTGLTITGTGVGESGNTPITFAMTNAPSDSKTGNTIALRDAGGDLQARYIMSTYCNMNHGVSTRSADTVFYSSTDDYIRKNNKTGFLTSIGIPPKSSLSLSGTEKTFTSLPSGIDEIEIWFDAVSTNGTSRIQVELGDSGGIENTSYFGGTEEIVGGTAASGNSSGTGFTFGIANNDSTKNYNGILRLRRTSGNNWIAEGSLGAGSDWRYINQTKSLSGTLDRVRVTTVGHSNTFDNGTATLVYRIHS